MDIERNIEEYNREGGENDEHSPDKICIDEEEIKEILDETTRLSDLSKFYMSYIEDFNFEEYIQSNHVDNLYEIYRISKLFKPLSGEEMEVQKKYLSISDIRMELRLAFFLLDDVISLEDINNDTEYKIKVIDKFICTFIAINKDLIKIHLAPYYNKILGVLNSDKYYNTKLYNKFMPIFDIELYMKNAGVKTHTPKEYKTSSNLKYIKIAIEVIENNVYFGDWQFLGRFLWINNYNINRYKIGSFSKDEVYFLSFCIDSCIKDYHLSKVKKIFRNIRHIYGKESSLYLLDYGNI